MSGLAYWMGKRGVTQYRLHKLSGVSQASISAILSGKTKSPGTQMMSRLAAALDCTIDDLLREAADNKDSA